MMKFLLGILCIGFCVGFVACPNGSESVSDEEKSVVSSNGSDSEEGAGNATIFERGTLATDIANYILGLTEDKTIVLKGPINAVTLKTIGSAMRENESVGIYLDISNTSGIREIKKDYFKDCLSLSGIELPATVTKIENFAFYYTGLEKIYLPESVTDIGMYAFADCPKLKDAIIPDSVTDFDQGIFCFDSALENVVLGKNFTEIKPHTFSKCYSLTDLTINGKMTSISDEAYGDPYSIDYKYFSIKTLHLNADTPDKNSNLSSYFFEKLRAGYENLIIGTNCKDIYSFGNDCYYNNLTLLGNPNKLPIIPIKSGSEFSLVFSKNIDYTITIQNTQSYSEPCDISIKKYKAGQQNLSIKLRIPSWNIKPVKSISVEDGVKVYIENEIGPDEYKEICLNEVSEINIGKLTLKKVSSNIWKSL